MYYLHRLCGRVIKIKSALLVQNFIQNYRLGFCVTSIFLFLNVAYANTFLSPESAIKLIKERHNGTLIKIVSVSKTTNSDCPLYRIRILEKGKLHICLVDACKGEVIEKGHTS